MPLDLTKLRNLVTMDDSDALSRFALGQALFQQGDSSETLNEAAEHLLFANARPRPPKSSINVTQDFPDQLTVVV